MALREIIAHFGFDFDDHKLETVNQKIRHTKNESEGAAGGVNLMLEAFQAFAAVELVKQASEWVEGLVETATELERVSMQTGLSTKELQVWELGAAESGIRAEEFTLSLRRLSSAIAGGKDEAGTQTAVFAKLGIKTKDAAGHTRTLSEILPEIADHFQSTKDGAGKAALAQELFGRSGARMIPLLNKGSAGVKELTKDFEALGGGFSEEMIERAAEFEKQSARLRVGFNSLKSVIGVYLLPYLTSFLENLTAGVSAFREWAKETTLVESGVKTLAKAIGFTLWAALSPFLFGALKFAAIFLAFDDLDGFLEGQDSLIGRLLDHMFGDGTATVVREWIQDAVEWFSSGFTDVRAVLSVFGDGFSASMAAWAVEWDGFVLGIEQAWNAVVSKLHLPDSLRVDTGDRQDTTNKDKAALAAADERQTSARAALTQYQLATTPTTGQIATGPVAQNVVYQNSVELNPTVQITVAPGANEHQTIRNVKAATNEAMREQRRAALQTLEDRTGGK
jgi:hypothetical protein